MIEDAPILPSDAHAFCVFKGLEDCSVARAPVEKMFLAVATFREELVEKYPEIVWIDPKPAVCAEQRCETLIDNVPLYRDHHHLNYRGSVKLAEAYIARFGNPLRSMRQSVQ